MSVNNWKLIPKPDRTILDGVYARLEPFNLDQHAQSLFEAASSAGAEDRFRYLFDKVPSSFAEFKSWAVNAEASTDPLFFSVIDKATDRAEGRQALMRIDSAQGVIEIGNIMWGPTITRTRIATEALFLLADYVFSLGYRRLEWKCDNNNLPSKHAAQRFGFSYEGTFRQHMIVKGLNRDTAWFSIIDSEWPRLRSGYERWLKADNFDTAGQQMSKLIFNY